MAWIGGLLGVLQTPADLFYWWRTSKQSEYHHQVEVKLAQDAFKQSHSFHAQEIQLAKTQHKMELDLAGKTFLIGTYVIIWHVPVEYA